MASNKSRTPQLAYDPADTPTEASKWQLQNKALDCCRDNCISPVMTSNWTHCRELCTTRQTIFPAISHFIFVQNTIQVLSVFQSLLCACSRSDSEIVKHVFEHDLKGSMSLCRIVWCQNVDMDIRSKGLGGNSDDRLRHGHSVDKLRDEHSVEKGPVLTILATFYRMAKLQSVYWLSMPQVVVRMATFSLSTEWLICE